ncbi:ParB/RepB/Spo0J family partition protein [Desulfopila sp. IMCC35006]|uniref:ParB/RepB/Spo0J family partition protein n=1 Tax=Desulfopila sp. IMCC35006 TaxID=2569542 RepID=UPI0010ACDEBE|nr:ParB/RepB/Spo0J family partition protein [Desulfopila sp. IMCC35006]TKB23699.1 ParB/RepB/Spo0J family partition protein [Desulfopila sp. IMCC35006]
MVDFKKKTVGKTTKLATKTLQGIDAKRENPVFEQYTEGNLYKVPLKSIEPDPDQPRKHFDQIKLEELATSISSKGVLQPIIVRKNDIDKIDADFLIIAGERRYRASKIAKLDVIPVIFSKGDPAEIALIENIQRDDLNPIEEAYAYSRIMESHGYNQNQLSEVVGKARTTINEILTLNKLPDELKDECRTSDTPKNVLLEIAKIKDPKEMIFLYNKVKNENLTVAKIRQLTRPKPVRILTPMDKRVIAKIQEVKRLLPKINKVELNSGDKDILWSELSELQDVISGLLSQ